MVLNAIAGTVSCHVCIFGARAGNCGMCARDGCTTRCGLEFSSGSAIAFCAVSTGNTCVGIITSMSGIGWTEVL